jgi:hypothetical protein
VPRRGAKRPPGGARSAPPKGRGAATRPKESRETDETADEADRRNPGAKRRAARREAKEGKQRERRRRAEARRPTGRRQTSPKRPRGREAKTPPGEKIEAADKSHRANKRERPTTRAKSRAEGPGGQYPPDPEGRRKKKEKKNAVSFFSFFFLSDVPFTSLKEEVESNDSRGKGCTLKRRGRR